MAHTSKKYKMIYTCSAYFSKELLNVILMSKGVENLDNVLDED